MNILSVNVGLPREVIWDGKRVTTGIFKEPVAGVIRLRTLNLAGDKQADLTVHGGRDKAVYCYPAEHYDYWRGELPGVELPWGMFGENFTTTGIDESGVCIGDQFRIGSAIVQVTEPRMPCYKLGIKFGRDDIIKRFLASGRTGFYLAVLQEGEVKAGDAVDLIQRGVGGVSIADVTRLYSHEKTNRELLRRVLQAEDLPQGWRDYFQRRLERLDSARSS